MNGLPIGQYQRRIPRILLGQLAQTEFHEFRGMHRVIGKQNVFLHRIDLDAGVMLNARTGNIETLRPEVKERLFPAMEGIPLAINNRIIDLIQGRARDGAALLRRRRGIFDVFRRNALIRLAHEDIARIVIGQPRQLLVQVLPDDVRLGDDRRILAGLVHIAKGLGAVNRLPFTDLHCHLGINHMAITIEGAGGKGLARHLARGFIMLN